MENNIMKVEGYKSGVVNGASVTTDNFDKVLFNKLADAGFICSLKQVAAIKRAVFSTLNECTTIGNVVDPVAKTTFLKKKVNSRIYVDILNKENGVETLIVAHPEVVYNRKNIAPEEEIKFKGKRDKNDPNIFITTDGEKINIKDKEAEILKKYLSKDRNVKIGSDKKFSDELLKKAFYNVFNKGVSAADATVDSDDEADVEEAAVETTDEAKPVRKIKKVETAEPADEIENEDDVDEVLDNIDTDEDENDLPMSSADDDDEDDADLNALLDDDDE